MLSNLPVHVEVGKGKPVEAVVVSVVFGGVVDLAVVLVVDFGVVLVVVLGVVLGAEVVVLGVLEVLVVAGYVHCEHEASTVRLLGEQTSNGT